MTAMDRRTGKALSGREEIEQALDEILDTPRGERLMRAEYGSDLFKLVDVGMDASGKAKLSQAIAEAIERHEPRVRLTRVAVHAEPGELHYDLHGYVRTGSITVRR